MDTPTRIGNLELDGADLTHKPATTTSSITVQGVTSVVQHTPGKAAKGVEVSATARGRILAQQAALLAAGFASAKTSTSNAGDTAGEDGVTAWNGLAIGTRVRADGDKKLRESRMKFEEQPLAVEALEQLRDTVKAEGRYEVPAVSLATLLCRYNPNNVEKDGPKAVDAALAVKNGSWHVIDPTPTALRHVGAFMGIEDGGVGYFAKAPARVRAAMVEEYRGKIDPTREVVLGLKKNVASDKPGATTCYRVASPNYTPYEVDRACEDLLASTEVRDLLKGARCSVRYDGERATIRVIWHEEATVDFAAGDVFKAAATFTLDDVRGASIKTDSSAWRNRCLNLQIIGKQTKRGLRRRHTGAVEGIAGEFVEAALAVKDDFAAFLPVWNAARQDKIVEQMGGDPGRVFAGLVGAGLVTLKGTQEQQVLKLMAAWNAEPGYTRADVLNAVTRAAHEGAWWGDLDAANEVEQQAGQLLYVTHLAQRLTFGAQAFTAKTGIEF